MFQLWQNQQHSTDQRPSLNGLDIEWQLCTFNNLLIIFCVFPDALQ